MQVFGFDLLPYPEHLDHLDAWVRMEELGFDGIGFNEHHTSPYGLMTSPNLMAASAAQRTQRIKLLIYGNLLPIHEPLRLAEELAMLDCLSTHIPHPVPHFCRHFRGAPVEGESGSLYRRFHAL